MQPETNYKATFSANFVNVRALIASDERNCSKTIDSTNDIKEPNFLEEYLSKFGNCNSAFFSECGLKINQEKAHFYRIARV